jgi:hypothetical protein
MHSKRITRIRRPGVLPRETGLFRTATGITGAAANREQVRAPQEEIRKSKRRSLKGIRFWIWVFYLLVCFDFRILSYLEVQILTDWTVSGRLVLVVVGALDRHDRVRNHLGVKSWQNQAGPKESTTRRRVHVLWA